MQFFLANLYSERLAGLDVRPNTTQPAAGHDQDGPAEDSPSDDRELAKAEHVA